jgi:hypothetical protein
MSDTEQYVGLTENQAELLARTLRRTSHCTVCVSDLNEDEVDTIEALAIRFERTANSLYMIAAMIGRNPGGRSEPADAPG